MACDATARLYDVDEDSVVFKRFDETKSYDQGTVAFRARNGALVDLAKLHESLWATRLSGGTRSGLVKLEVTARGSVVTSSGETVLKVAGSDAELVLVKHTDAAHAAAFEKLRAWVGENRPVRITGQVDNYFGRWPGVLGKQPPTPRRILVTRVEIEEIQ